MVESVSFAKKKKPTVTPRRDEFAEYPDFKDLFVYQADNEITVRMEDYKVKQNSRILFLKPKFSLLP